MMDYRMMDSPLGPILLAGDGDGLKLINFQEGDSPVKPPPNWRLDENGFANAVEQLSAYFEGNLREFDLTLALEGTPFYRQVWRELERIPYGQTVSYGELAGRVGKPRAARAVGAANGRNPLPIVGPCHRVIGSNGRLTGYGGGLRFKQALLELERRHSPVKSGQQFRLGLA